MWLIQMRLSQWYIAPYVHMYSECTDECNECNNLTSKNGFIIGSGCVVVSSVDSQQKPQTIYYFYYIYYSVLLVVLLLLVLL